MRLILVLNIILFFGSKASHPNDVPSKKKAIIVAISEYAPHTGWRKINASNDINIIWESLRVHGFQEKDILILKDEQATKKNILQTFKTHFSSLENGDFAYFHFSGHGQQVLDKNMDELDGKDEALVPYDASEAYKANDYKGELHITDDELQSLLYPLQKKLGAKGQVLVTIDACHSGTATRELNHLGSSRGSILFMGPRENQQETLQNNLEAPFLNTSYHKQDATLAPLVLFTATMQDELNYEIIPHGQSKIYGPLSYAFGKAFSKINGRVSYDTLFEEIKKIIAQYNQQSPTAEGQLDQIIFNANLKGKNTYFKVVKSNQHVLEIDGGTFAGLLPGTEISIYPKETFQKNPKQRLARGIISESFTFSSYIKLEWKDVDLEELKNTWVYVDTYQLGELNIDIKLDIDNLALKTAVEKQLKLLSNYTLVNHQSQVTIKQKNKFPLEVFSSEDVDLISKDISSYTIEEQANYIIDKVLLPYAQSKYLSGFSFQDEYMNVEMELIPLKTKQGSFIADDINSKKNECGEVEFQVGDRFQLKVTNHGDTGIYFSIYDIQPNGKVNTLIPHSNRTKEEYFLDKGESRNWGHRWKIGPPYGKEVFKLVALKSPVNILDPYTNGKNVIFTNPPTKGINPNKQYLKSNIIPNTVYTAELVFYIH